VRCSVGWAAVFRVGLQTAPGRTRLLRCLISSSVAGSGVSVRLGKAAFYDLRPLAVERVGKTSPSGSRASSGSRAGTCAPSNWV
jgi:hypothetical protein